MKFVYENGVSCGLLQMNLNVSAEDLPEHLYILNGYSFQPPTNLLCLVT
jgi:hypothetical protein